MRRGDIVKVYRNPVNERGFEGRARLLRCIRKQQHENDKFEVWLVRFVKESHNSPPVKRIVRIGD